MQFVEHVCHCDTISVLQFGDATGWVGLLMMGELVAAISLPLGWAEADCQMQLPVRRVQLMVGPVRGKFSENTQQCWFVQKDTVEEK